MSLPRDGQDLATACVLCSKACGLRVDVADGRIVKVRPDPGSPHSRGYICNKGYTIGSYIEHDQRLTAPLRRSPSGELEPVSWEQALLEIATRLNALREAHGPDAVGVVGLGGQASHLDAMPGVGLLSGLGSRYWFHTLGQEKTQHFLVDQWMFGALPDRILHADVAPAEVVVLIGTNPKLSNGGVDPDAMRAALARGSAQHIIVIDPRRTRTAERADQHLAVRPGGDLWLLAGLLLCILENGWQDQAFLDARAAGLEDLRSALAGQSVDALARRAGVEPAALREAAERYATAERACIQYELGAEHAPGSTLLSWLLHLLPVVTGNLEQPGGHHFRLAVVPTVGTLPEAQPRARVSGVEAIAALCPRGLLSPALLPEEVEAGHMRAVIVEGTNPLNSYPDTTRMRATFERLDLVVVIDPVLSETAQAADYVLPVPVAYETWEATSFPSTFPEVVTQLRPPVVPAPDGVLPVQEIFLRLAQGMRLFSPPPWPLRRLSRWADRPWGRHLLTGLALALAPLVGRGGEPEHRATYWLLETLGPRMPSIALVVAWLYVLVNAVERPAAVLRTLGPRFRLRGPFGRAEALWRRMLQHPEGVEIARVDPETHLDDTLRLPRIQLYPEPLRAAFEQALTASPQVDPAWPFILSAGLRTRWTANTLHRDPRWRKGKGPHGALSMNPQDADELGITEDGHARVETPRGAVVLPVRRDPRLQQGHISTPNGFGLKTAQGVDGVNINLLTDADHRDPFTGVPHHKHIRCRVSAAEVPPAAQG
ncbi:MAG: molybdopterin-dependent oxidoreductase [Alphaproteobacteria bacterium]|nr:molybdopterin-dependent oxidoreductase [Alphaproteobacteria bacterium]